MFVNDLLLLLLLTLPVMLGVFVWAARQRKAALAQLGDEGLVASLVMRVSESRRRWKSALWVFSVTMLIFALARPVWGIVEEIVEARGVAVMIVLDVSVSMDAEDILPSRLQRAKLAAREILDNSRGNEVGLILFAGTAFVQMPLTSDIPTALNFLNAASTEAITQQGTAIGEALSLALRSFDARTAPYSTIVLLTDGENHEGEPLRVADEIAERGVPVQIIGYGDVIDGAPIPIRDDLGEIVTYKADRNGNLVLTRLDEAILIEIADATGGSYERASDGGVEVLNLINTIDAIDGGTLGEDIQTRQVERFGIFVALALLALTLEILLPETRPEGANV